MHILVTGGTGLIGRRLIEARPSDRFTVLTRQRRLIDAKPAGRVRWVDVGTLGALQPAEPVDAVINLAGEPIADRPWTRARRQLLRSSRIGLTDQLVDAMARWPRPPRVLLSGSAVGFYPPSAEDVTESGPQGAGFAAELCRDWEAAARRAEAQGVPVACCRIGLVLDPRGGMLKKLLLPFRLGLGGRLGSGRQAMPWIHHRDLVRLLGLMLDSPDVAGPWNLSAPNPVANADFTRQLAAALRRPALVPVPAFGLRLLGEVSGLLLEGTRMVPARALALGFRFDFPELAPALADLLTEGTDPG